jgi:hypothetical protein
MRVELMSAADIKTVLEASTDGEATRMALHQPVRVGLGRSRLVQAIILRRQPPNRLRRTVEVRVRIPLSMLDTRRPCCS